MHIRKVSCLLFVSSLIATSQPSGWKVIRDKTNACQVAIPPDWKAGAIPGTADAPGNQGDLSVGSQLGKTVKPYNEMTQQVLMVDKMIQNTAQLVLYSNTPTKSDNPITPYHAMSPGKAGICTALFSARKGVTQDQVKKIAATLGPAN